MDNKLLMGEDINSNSETDPMKQGDPKGTKCKPHHECGSVPPEVIKRTRNSIEVSIDVDPNNANEFNRNQEKTMERIGFDPDEMRTHRVDVLWKIQDGRSLDTDASISDCLMYQEEQTKFQQTRSRVIPQFQKKPHKNWDEMGQDSQTQLDPNQNQLLLLKKSEEGNGSKLPGHDGDMSCRPPNGRKRLTRREPLTWPWHSGSYEMNIRFQSQQFRTQFSTKVLFMKALQWALATIWTYVAYHINYFRENQNDLSWTMYLSFFLLMSTFLTVRSTNIVDNRTSIAVLFLYTVCITHLSAMLHIHYDCAVIPIVLMTLMATYVLSAVTFSCIQIDAESSLVFYPVFIYVIMTSIMSFWLVLAIRKETMQNPLAKMLTIWFPCCLTAMIVCSLEMLEIQALLQGTRTPLEPNEWILAGTFLL